MGLRRKFRVGNSTKTKGITEKCENSEISLYWTLNLGYRRLFPTIKTKQRIFRKNIDQFGTSQLHLAREPVQHYMLYLYFRVSLLILRIFDDNSATGVRAFQQKDPHLVGAIGAGSIPPARETTTRHSSQWQGETGAHFQGP